MTTQQPAYGKVLKLERWELQPFYVEPIGDDGFFFSTSLMGIPKERFFYAQAKTSLQTK